jgi:hypothetical protein
MILIRSAVFNLYFFAMTFLLDVARGQHDTQRPAGISHPHLVSHWHADGMLTPIATGLHMPRVDAPVPDFALSRSDGTLVRLADFTPSLFFGQLHR